jgi:hypothetical protein
MRLAPCSFNLIRQHVGHDDPVRLRHGLKRADTALIPAGELRDFADLPLIFVHLFRRHAVDLCGGEFVDVLPFLAVVLGKGVEIVEEIVVLNDLESMEFILFFALA